MVSRASGSEEKDSGNGFSIALSKVFVEEVSGSGSIWFFVLELEFLLVIFVDFISRIFVFLECLTGL